jgi:hypothetical protein
VTKAFLKQLWGQRLAQASLVRIYATVRHFARWLDRKFPNLFPLGCPTEGIKPPAEPEAHWKGLTRLEEFRLRNAAQTLRVRPGPGTQQGLRNHALLAVLLGSGLRISKVPQLDRDQYTGICSASLVRPMPTAQRRSISRSRHTSCSIRSCASWPRIVWETERFASRATLFFRGATAWELLLQLRHTPPVPGTGISTLCGLLGLRGRVVMRSCVEICSHSYEHPAHPRVIDSHVRGGVLRVWTQGHAHPLVALQPFQPIDVPPQHLDLIGEAGLHHGPG